MVTSEAPVSGSLARTSPMVMYGPASSKVWVGAGISRRRSKGGRMTTSWQGAVATVTGAQV